MTFPSDGVERAAQVLYHYGHNVTTEQMREALAALPAPPGAAHEAAARAGYDDGWRDGWAAAVAAPPGDLVGALRECRTQAEWLIQWIERMPSNDAVWEGCNTEANQVHHTPGQPWRDKSGEMQRHWFDHVGPAIRAAFAEEMRLAEPPFHPLQKLRAAITRADAALASPERETGTPDE